MPYWRGALASGRLIIAHAGGRARLMMSALIASTSARKRVIGVASAGDDDAALPLLRPAQ